MIFLYENLLNNYNKLKDDEGYSKIQSLSKLPNNYNYLEMKVKADETLNNFLTEIKIILDKFNLNDKQIIKADKKDLEFNYEKFITLTGHTSTVSCLYQLADGRLASGSGDNTIRIWDPKNNFFCTYTLTGHTNTIWTLLLLNDGKLVSGSWDKKIFIWDINNQSVKMELNIHSDRIRPLLDLKNGYLVSASEDNSTIIWDVNTGVRREQLIGHTGIVRSLALLPNGNIASGSVDKSIIIWGF
jgi:WD40 repeat protein